MTTGEIWVSEKGHKYFPQLAKDKDFLNHYKGKIRILGKNIRPCWGTSGSGSAVPLSGAGPASTSHGLFLYLSSLYHIIRLFLILFRTVLLVLSRSRNSMVTWKDSLQPHPTDRSILSLRLLHFGFFWVVKVRNCQ